MTSFLFHFHSDTWNFAEPIALPTLGLQRLEIFDLCGNERRDSTGMLLLGSGASTHSPSCCDGWPILWGLDSAEGSWQTDTNRYITYHHFILLPANGCWRDGCTCVGASGRSNARLFGGGHLPIRALRSLRCWPN